MSLICIVCPPTAVKFDNVDSLEAHIACDHINYFNYKCPQCRFERFCTETVLHEHCIAVHQSDQYEVNYKVDNRTLEQRTRVRVLLLESLKYSWTSVVDSTNMINGDNSLDDDAQLIATSGVHVPFDDDQQQQQEVDEAMERDSTKIDLKSLFTSAPQVARVVTTKLTDKMRKPVRESVTKIGKKHESLQMSIAENSNNEADQLKCTECDKLISQTNHRRSHAALHLNKVMYECQLCGHESRALKKLSIKQHVKTKHPGSDYTLVITNNTTKYAKELQAMCVKCFGYEYKRRKMSNKKKGE